MPLQDHFHPPLSRQRHWESFHGAWAEAIARHFNEDLLPAHYYAEARVHLGGRVEVDVGTFDNANAPREGGEAGGVAVWAPPRPVATAELDFAHLDLIEVGVFNDEEGPRLVAALELVSPANKDRPSHRQMFAVKCASYLQEGISLALVDVVTDRHGNLHAGLLELLNLSLATPALGPSDLYASAYRVLPRPDSWHLEIWAEPLGLGMALPILPLWLSPELNLPVDLETTYLAACAARRISLG